MSDFKRVGYADDVQDHSLEGLGEFVVSVLVGVENYSISVPDKHITNAWLISEVIRRYMDDHDDEDPGVVGLRCVR